MRRQLMQLGCILQQNADLDHATGQSLQSAIKLAKGLSSMVTMVPIA